MDRAAIRFFLFGFVFMLLFGCDSSEPNQQALDIEAALNIWFKDQITAGELLPTDSCKAQFFSEPDKLPGFAYKTLGVPSSGDDIKMYSIDLGNDSVADALILFHPEQCDGGNASRWIQYQLLAVSHDGGYYIHDSYFKQFETEKGFVQFSRAEGTAVYGNYYEFYDNDPACCPSVKRPLKLDLRTNSMEIMK